MRDSFGRNIDYMRISITDRCNLRCRYCMPVDLPFVPHDSILRYEEILRVVKIMAKLGILRFKVTGGEPLVRRGCVDFFRELKSVPHVKLVTLTTNGVLLEDNLAAISSAGIDCVNISLDTLNAEKYSQITGQDEFKRVMRAINKSLDSELRVKINCVPIRGMNENEALDFARLAERLPLDVRFIELMPTETNGGFECVKSCETLAALKAEYPDLIADTSPRGNGPARYYKSEKLKGAVGFIDSISNHFCEDCNRLRLTGTGFLKLCLYHNDGLDLRAMLRSGASDDEIAHAVKDAVMLKPDRHCFTETNGHSGGIGKMSGIGG